MHSRHREEEVVFLSSEKYRHDEGMAPSTSSTPSSGTTNTGSSNGNDALLSSSNPFDLSQIGAKLVSSLPQPVQDAVSKATSIAPWYVWAGGAAAPAQRCGRYKVAATNAPALGRCRPITPPSNRKPLILLTHPSSRPILTRVIH